MKKKPLVIVSYGGGTDSTAGLVEFARMGLRPDLILFADTGAEREHTYGFLNIMDRFLAKAGFPTITKVQYKVKNFKHWPPYYGLEDNCLTNGTLPSLAFGFKSCSQKWKIAPMDKYCQDLPMLKEAWATGREVIKMIGYDCTEEYRSFAVENKKQKNAKYTYWYPLQDWKWGRDDCKNAIAKAGLIQPHKSSCFFCPAMKPWEVADLSREKLRRIVFLEARATPRLTKIQGLWRTGTKGTRGGIKRPGLMTEFILEEKLLPADEIEEIWQMCPPELFAGKWRVGNETWATWRDFQKLKFDPCFCG